MFKILPYLTAGIGMSFAIFFIKHKKIRYAFFTVLFSIAIVFGGTIHIEKIFSGNLEMLTNKVTKLEKEFKQDISQNVNIITRVEKEIANIQETLTQIYKQKRTEKFCFNDSLYREKIQVDKSRGHITLTLKEPAIDDSITVTKRIGDTEISIPFMLTDIMDKNYFFGYGKEVHIYEKSGLEDLLKSQTCYIVTYYAKDQVIVKKLMKPAENKAKKK